MKKTISLCCALAVVFSMCLTCKVLPVSAETQKFISGNVILPGSTEPTELKTFVYEDFEGYDTTNVFETPYISKYVNENVEFKGIQPNIQSAPDLNGYGMRVSTNSSYSNTWTYRQASITVNPAYWQPGNKITKFSFDAQNVGSAQIPTYFLWAKELDADGYTTGTTTYTGLLGSSLTLGVGYAPSCAVSNYKNLGSSSLSGGYKKWYGEDNNDLGTDAHFEITITYSNITETSLRANFTIAIYPFQTNGDYSQISTFTGTTYSYTADFDCSSVEGLTAEKLTLIPMIDPIINIGNTTFDNLRIDSVDSEVLNYLQNYGDVFETDATQSEWEEASLALNSQQELVKKRLAYYAERIDEHYAESNRMVTDDFSDAFRSSMFWSNYDNLKVENGGLVGVNDSNVRCIADGALANDKVLSAVYLKNVRGYNVGTGSSSSAANTTSIYPLYCGTNDLSIYAPIYFYGNSNGTYQLRIDPHGGLESWQNICSEKDYGNFAYTSTNQNGDKMTDIDLAIFYDWSQYNAENDYKIILTYSIKYKKNGEGEYIYASCTKPLHLGTAIKEDNLFVGSDVSAFTTIPQPEDFKFGFRNIGSVDSISVCSTDQTSGAVTSNGLYFNSTDQTDSNNGALVFTMENQTFMDNTLAEVVDYGSVFLNKATLTANGLSENDLTMDTDKAIKISAQENGIQPNAAYNVRINGTQNATWAAEKIVARTYVTYKVGTQIFTVYGDLQILSNMANLRMVAENHSVDLTGKSFEQAIDAVSNKRYEQ